MRRAAGHIRERAPGSFEVRYSLGTDIATGKRRIATATVRGSRKDAEKELRRLLHAVDTGEHVGPSRMTVRQWLTTWLATVRQEISPKTHERYSELVASFIVPALGALQLTKLTPAHLQTLFNDLAIGGRRDGKEGAPAPGTRIYIYRVLSSALTKAIEQQLLVRNPIKAVRPPKLERRQMKALTFEQARLLLDTIRENRIYPSVLLAIATGARRGEILALRWKNVDLDHAEIRVVESLEQTKTSVRFKPPKTDRTRSVTLPSFAAEELRRLRRQQAESLLALGIRQDGETLVCARYDGEPLRPQTISHEFPRVLAKLGPDFPRVRFHDLRHSHATQLLLAGIHPKIAQERLGHSTVTTTLDLYSHVTKSMQKDAAGRIDEAFRGAR